MNYFNYFSEIEETFIRRRGKNLLLSPLDWSLIESWKEREIPLAIVLRAINNVFDAAEAQPSARKRSIKSLMYCRDEVEAQFAEWIAHQVGNQSNAECLPENAEIKNTDLNTNSQSSFSRQAILNHLNNAAEKLPKPAVNLNHNWQTISAKALQQLSASRQNFLKDGDVERLENVLNELDYKLDKALLESFPPEKFKQLTQETALQLQSFKRRMSEESYEQTFRTLLLKTLREEANLPRFSLVYL